MPDRLDTILAAAAEKTILAAGGNILGTAITYTRKSGSPTTNIDVDFDVPEGRQVEGDDGGTFDVREATVSISKGATGLADVPVEGDVVVVTSTAETWKVRGAARTVAGWWVVEVRKVEPKTWSATQVVRGAK